MEFDFICRKGRPFEAYFKKQLNGCWKWIGAKSGHLQPYGMFKRKYAHRFSYEKAKGKIPSHLQIDHLCRNRICVNPDHLEAVTQKVNIRRGNLAKLAIEQVNQIRKYGNSIPAFDLAEQFEVTRRHIYQILGGHLWV